MALVHVSEAEAVRDLPGLLARVRAGVEVVIEHDAVPSIMLRVVAEPTTRQLSESLRLAKEHGSRWQLDPGFSGDLEAVVESHSEPLADVWAESEDNR